MLLNDKKTAAHIRAFASAGKLEVIYCDNHILVLNKPAGILIQRDKTGDSSLIEYAKAYIKDKYNKPGNVYLGLVHRLDRPVSGVVVFARTSKAASRLSNQFKERTTGKIYTAIVEGEIPAEGDWLDSVARRGVTSYIAEDGEGRPADLHFSRLIYKDGFSLVRIRLGTGRHHQIRIQFSSRGYPIVGDFRYGSGLKFGDRAIALHSSLLKITHPTTKEEMTFRAKPAEIWHNYFTEI
ncbi:MAG: RluA family pseudouridine synthase [bacterium]|nr:RluA family pseudouridine synthase [bacterium]